jgi:hypothetical protein
LRPARAFWGRGNLYGAILLRITGAPYGVESGPVLGVAVMTDTDNSGKKKVGNI